MLSIGAVDFGIIVDSSVIIVERIYHHVTTHTEQHHRPLIDRIMEATAGVERPMFFSAMIIVCAFLPLFTMTGPAGALFSPMAATYAFSIFGALLIATTLVPVLCSFFFHGKGTRRRKEPILDRIMKGIYLRLLRVALSHRGFTLALTAGLLAYTVSLLPNLGAEFMPVLEEGNLWIRAFLPRTVSRDGRPGSLPASAGRLVVSRGPRRDVPGGPAG